MRILLISHTFPYPPNEGIKLPLFYLIKEFSKKHEVTLLSFILEEEKKYIEIIKEYCFVETIELKVKNFLLYRVALTLFSNDPYNTIQFFYKDFLDKFIELTNHNNFDLFFFDFLTTTYYKKFINIETPSVLHYHDAMSMLFYGNFINERNIFKKLYWYLQYKKLINYEFCLQNLFDKIVVVAKKDKDWLLDKSKLTPNKIEVIPNGVDVDYFYYKFNKKFNEEPYSILFRGIMNFKPNIDACLYFLKEIYPLLKKEIPQIKFYIVGPNPPNEILRYSKIDNSVVVTGYVEDIREYILKCKINISPMISGSGIKNKILESLAMGTPSVITTLAKEGIPELEDGENILIADIPEEFVKKIKLLFEDKNLYIKLASNGRNLVEKNYTWENVAEEFCKIFENLISEKIKSRGNI